MSLFTIFFNSNFVYAMQPSVACCHCTGFHSRYVRMFSLLFRKKITLNRMKKRFLSRCATVTNTTEFKTNMELDNISAEQLTIEPCVPWDNLDVQLCQGNTVKSARSFCRWGRAGAAERAAETRGSSAPPQNTPGKECTRRGARGAGQRGSRRNRTFWQ